MRERFYDTHGWYTFSDRLLGATLAGPRAAQPASVRAGTGQLWHLEGQA